MGPAMAGSAASRRSTPRSNFAPSIAPSTSSTSSLGAGLSQTAPPSLKKDVDLKGKGKEVAKQDEDEEVYSDPDEGVEIVDMERVREMDWMAPESLRKEKAAKKKVKKEQANDPDVRKFFTK
jgi:DNA-directed RNA polymerase III subunit RPC4